MAGRGSNIIHLVHLTSAPGGLEVILPVIVKELPEFEFRAFIIRPQGERKPDVYGGTALLRKYGSGNNIVAAAKLFMYIRHSRKEIFHVFNSGPLFLLTIRLAGARRLIYSIHGTLYWKNLTQRLMVKLAWRLALSERFRLTANSSYSRKVFIESVMLPAQEIGIIYNPIGTESAPDDLPGRKAESLTIGYAGRLVHGKNLFLWLSVAQKLSLEFSSIRFIIFGDGVLKDNLIKRAAELGISNLITFRGYVKEISSAYRECDAMMFLSERESFGNVVVESALNGTPVIASDIPAFREILGNWSYCLVPADDTAAAHVGERLRNIDRLRQCLPGMITEFRERFSREKHISEIRMIYESISS